MISSDDGDSSKAQWPAGLPSLDSVLQRQQPGTPPPASGSSLGQKRATPAKTLQQILTEAVGGQGVPAAPLEESHRGSPATHRAQGRADVLQQPRSNNAAAGPAREGETRRRHQQLPTLDNVLHSNQQPAGNGRPQRDTTSHRAATATLDDIVRTAGRTAVPSCNEPEAGGAAPSRKSLVSVALFGLAVALVAAVVFHSKKALPDSEVARRLLTVAEDVARYRAQNHKLPQRLSELPGFPKDAVEWPIENYEVVLATPKLEFFLVDVPGGHIVIARFANEVWIYDSVKVKPLRRIQSG